MSLKIKEYTHTLKQTNKQKSKSLPPPKTKKGTKTSEKEIESEREGEEGRRERERVSPSYPDGLCSLDKLETLSGLQFPELKNKNDGLGSSSDSVSNSVF